MFAALFLFKQGQERAAKARKRNILQEKERKKKKNEKQNDEQ